MISERRSHELEVHLTEYNALRTEMLALIKLRENLVFVALSISGALFSFAFSGNPPSESNSISRWTSLYLITPLSLLVGGLWVVNTWRIHRISAYIKDVIRLRIESLLLEPNERIYGSVNILEWESSQQRLHRKWFRRIIEFSVYFMAFFFSGVIAQFLLLIGKEGNIFIKVRTLDLPILYYINCFFQLITIVSLLIYLLIAKKYKFHSPISISN